jgi:hypothetical protein
MFGQGKVLLGATQSKNSGDPEIAIVLFNVAPADQVLAEGVKNQPDGFHFSDGNLFLLIGISDLQDLLGTDGLLDARQIFKALHKTYRHLQLDIGS